MLVSYNWLQKYFKEPLPPAEKIAELFTFHAFEVEGVNTLPAQNGRAEDTIIDVKVLPDRAHYALSHRGIAYELAAILGTTISSRPKDMYLAQLPAVQKTRPLALRVENKELCRRHTGRVIEGIEVAPSPKWLAEMLEAIGQRSINTIVDATNFVTFDMGQPIHAFDADKVKGELVVRLAKKGEKVVLLDGKEIALPESALVIADDEGPLDIAGIKGGNRAIINNETKNIILEAANFDPASIRRTSTLTGVRSDASKRFENEITPEFAEQGMERVTSLIMKMNPKAKMGEFLDLSIQPAQKRTIIFTLDDITSRLGVAISEKEIVALLARIGVTVAAAQSTAHYIVAIPAERLDLVIPADLAEEVGRLYGYEKIPPALLAPLASLSASAKVAGNKRFYWEQMIRSLLVEAGFSEVFTHSLVDAGTVEIQNPLASDKCALRGDLSKGLAKALELNTRNAPLLTIGIGKQSAAVKIFEIGNIFDGKSAEQNNEHVSLAAGVAMARKLKKGEETINDQIRQLREQLLTELEKEIKEHSKEHKLNIVTLCTIDDTGGLIMLAGSDGKQRQIGMINAIDGIMEFNLDALIDVLPEPIDWKNDLRSSDAKYANAKYANAKYAKISSYPFVLRDIAVFVPTELTSDAVAEVINREAKANGDLLVRAALFDVFTKKFPEGASRTSHAFNLVFQSHDRTLSDDEVSAVMKKISDAMTANGWQVR